MIKVFITVALLAVSTIVAFVVMTNTRPQYDRTSVVYPTQGPVATDSVRSLARLGMADTGYRSLVPSDAETTIRERDLKDCLEKNSRGQHKEGLAVYHRFFRNRTTPGFYMEMGALDGWWFSNTWLYEKCFGWDGLLVEGHPDNWKKLAANENRTAMKLHMAACPGPATVIFSGAGWASSKLVQDDKGKVAPCGPLSEQFERLSITHIDFLSLDVENHELTTLRSIDFGKVSISVILAETAFQKEDIKAEIFDLLNSKGFQHQGVLFTNDIFVHQAESSR